MPWWVRFSISKEDWSSADWMSKNTSVAPGTAELAAVSVRRKTISVGANQKGDFVFKSLSIVL